jgi:alanine dehydrogenase
MSRSPHEEPGMSPIVSQGILLPKESMLEVRHSNQNLFIGIPKETSFQENRISLVPESVALLVNNGHQVLIETNAGKNANFTDTDYSEGGSADCDNSR